MKLLTFSGMYQPYRSIKGLHEMFPITWPLLCRKSLAGEVDLSEFCLNDSQVPTQKNKLIGLTFGFMSHVHKNSIRIAFDVHESGELKGRPRKLFWYEYLDGERSENPMSFNLVRVGYKFKYFFQFTGEEVQGDIHAQFKDSGEYIMEKYTLKDIGERGWKSGRLLSPYIGGRQHATKETKLYLSF